MYPSIPQILIILVIFLLLFGHKRIREFGKSLGEALRDFKKGLEGKTMTDEKNDTVLKDFKKDLKDKTDSSPPPSASSDQSKEKSSAVLDSKDNH